MQKIPLKLATPGMKLAKAVINDRGMTLCGAGTELNEETLARLARIEVERITVEGHPVELDGEGKGLSQQIDELHARFRKVDKNPLMKKIKNVLLEILTEGTQEG
ncbi:MAG: hypothetical protein JRD47_04400 [Deltaproteobacteria bacterium]|nr:hypothetical protein [Deltaproteobacteria bacterium]